MNVSAVVLGSTMYSLRVYFRRTLVLLGATGTAGLATSCGGSTPSPEAPASTPAEEAPHSEAPSQPAPAAAPQERISETQSLEYEADLADQGFADEDVESGGEPTPSKEAPKRERAFVDQYDLPKALTAIANYDAQFSAAVELSAPNCERAETYRRTVCQLAERICELEQDLPSTAKERHCTDSRARCSAATSRYAQSCEP